ncbi:MAG: amino acid ABC transporter substrate-binding protein [Pseudomonadota bacterium]
MTPNAFFDLLAPRRLVRAATAFAMGFAVSQSEVEQLGSKLEQIRDRGVLLCGVDTNLPGFAMQTGDGTWEGFEADLCRAYAAAFLGRADQVRFVPLTTAERFEAVSDGRADILVRNTSWTLAREADLSVSFVGVYYHDGQGFLTANDLGVASARELDGARICVQSQTTTALNLADYAQAFGVSFQPVEADTAIAALRAYEAGACDALTNDISSLAGLRLQLDDPSSHSLLPDVISKEPLGPVVSDADPRFADTARWVLYALIAAEEYGVTAQNARVIAETSTNPELRRLLGAEGAVADALGLDAEFALRAIEATGNYAEIFERHLGLESELQLRRGLNAQWTEGGLLYAPPFR